MTVEQEQPAIVTILILIDGFLQFEIIENMMCEDTGHNPYFNRWFSAIKTKDYVNGAKVMSQSLF